WNTAVSFFLQPRDHLSIRQIVWQGETIDPRRHAIFRGLITEFDDFMNHLSFFFLQCAFLFAHFNQRTQLLVAQSLAGAQMEELYEFTEPGTMLFLASELMRFERKERRFQSRKKGRTEDQN